VQPEPVHMYQSIMPSQAFITLYKGLASALSSMLLAVNRSACQSLATCKLSQQALVSLCRGERCMWRRIANCVLSFYATGLDMHGPQGRKLAPSSSAAQELCLWIDLLGHTVWWVQVVLSTYANWDKCVGFCGRMCKGHEAHLCTQLFWQGLQEG